MLTIKNKSICAALLLAAVGCQKAASSDLKEGIDSVGSNSKARESVQKMPTYDELAAMTHVKADRVPWTDTYWPTMEKGIARRWPSNLENRAIRADLAKSYASYIDGNSLGENNVLLSPGEKYDMLYRYRNGISVDTEGLKSSLAAIGGFEDQITENMNKVVDDSFVFSDEDMTKNFDWMKSVYDAWDGKFIKQFPMSFHGWDNFFSRNMNKDNLFLDLASSKYSKLRDWSWEGICHGWAPAALMEESPKHSVMVKMDDKQLLVTEGDIRGLLSNSWANHDPSDEQFFIGRRCEKEMSKSDPNKIPLDKDGRRYYGKMTLDNADINFSLSNVVNDSGVALTDKMKMIDGAEYKVYSVVSNESLPLMGYLLERRIWAENTAGRYAWFTTFHYDETVENLEQFVTGRGGNDISSVKEVKVEFYGCWDVNPASFHVALQKEIGKEKLGLVMDRTSEGQVWNQPVYDAYFEVGPKVPVEQPRKLTRSADASHIAHVSVAVRWSGEPGVPQLAYDSDFNEAYLQVSLYTYTLEFDRNGKVVGGEWDLKKGQAPKDLVRAVKPVWGTHVRSSLMNAANHSMNPPDFLFGFKKGSKPLDDAKANFDYTGIIAKIHDCSLANETDGEVTVEAPGSLDQRGQVSTKTIKYKTCVIEKK